MFTNDRYIKEKRPKSILCAPIINQGRLTGILYLENNLTTGAFTPDRIEVLGVLSSQIAISIDNARLYANLELKVDERTKELREAQGRIEQMAEMATGVLHNIGNILNSVNISNEEIAQTLRKSKIEGLSKANELLKENMGNINEFFTNNSKGKILPEYYFKIEKMLENEHSRLEDESRELTKKVAMMRDIIFTQQSYAKVEYYNEEIDISGIIENVLKIQHGSILKSDIKVVKNYSDVDKITAQKTKMLHIILNFFKNSREAMINNEPGNRILTIDIGQDNEHGVFIKVSDNGEGIDKENLKDIFKYGFTTKKDGHGFGLHTCAKYMNEMGGDIFAESSGHGKGATFTLVFHL